MKKTLLPIFFLLIFQLSFTKSFSQECKDVSISASEYNYSIGKFNECITDLNRCLHTKGGFDDEQQTHAYHLLAKCYLAIDSMSSADYCIEQLLILKDNFEPASDDPERFINELKIVKSKPNETIVSSVSKRPEDIRYAPATVISITHEEIIQRGYTDLIDVLKDLPGFDITVYYGQTYANIYARGLRTDFTDRILILVDGVEDNDLWNYFADISQQYPITNIKRIEVVYGPSSTMYGQNAFSGVINIITKEPNDFIKNDKRFGIGINSAISSYDTKYLDISTAFKGKFFSISLTGRFYKSSRPDLSSQQWWDYDPMAFDTVSYKSLNIHNHAEDYIKDNSLPSNSNLYTVYRNSAGKADSIILTDAGIELARNLDKGAYNQKIDGKSVTQFENSAQSAYINLKVKISDLSLGLVTWNKTEGSGTTSTDEANSVNGTKWSPSHTYLYLNYNKRINQKTIFSTLVDYKVNTIRNGSKITQLYDYANTPLQLKDLIDSTPSYFLKSYYYEQSEQFRSEFKVLYNQGNNFYITSGIELRNSQLQAYYLTSASGKPEENGIYTDTLPGGNNLNVNDVGIYCQAQKNTKSGFYFTLGARLDHDQIRTNDGLGYTFSQRAVIAKAYKNWIFKAIYSKGVENVSNFTKYNDVGIYVSNPDLKAETIYDYEFSASNKFANKFTADADFYYSNVKNAVALIRIPPKQKQNQNIGEYKVLGIQSNLYYTLKKLQATLNYSYTYSREEIDTNGTVKNLMVADIAPHKINALVNYVFLKHCNLNFRENYVSGKKAGPGTNNKNPITFFQGYAISSIVLGVNDILKMQGLTIQLACNNIFNKAYYSPGIIAAGGTNFPSAILQMGRNFSFRINYEF